MEKIRSSILLDIEHFDPEELNRRAREEMARRLTQEKYKYYEPNIKCEEYINAVGSGEHFIIMFSAANGVGKSCASGNIVANIVFPEKNAWFDFGVYKKWPFPKKGRVVSDPNNLTGVIETLHEWFPTGKYVTKKKGKNYDSYWKIPETGWDFDIMTYEQKPKEFEGPTLGFVWFDEPPPKPIFKACVARLRKGGMIFISATPLEGSGWLYDHIVDARLNTKDKKFKDRAEKQRVNIEADVWAACKDIPGTRGHLSRDNIEKMIAEYDEDEKQARVYGKFQHLAGLVYKNWSRDIHMIKPFEVNPREYCVYEMIDPHPRNEDAVQWVAVDKNHTKIVVDELYINPTSTEDLAMQIKAKASQFRVVKRLGDPSMFNKDQHQGDESLADKLRKHGLNYLPATKQRTMANQAIKDGFDFVKGPTGEMRKAPEILVFETCARTIWEIEHWRWDEWKGKTGENKDRKETPVDKDDHMIENLGRCMVQKPAFVPFVRENRQNYQHNYDPFDS